MSDDHKYPEITINVKKSKEERSVSPTFGNPKQSEQNEAMMRVGKHGKSHHQYMKVMESHEPVSKMRSISAKELAEHTKHNSAWLSLNGVVYDVTIYINFHPGGEIILKGCGKACDDLFNQYHPWVNGKHLLQKYALGYLTN